MCEEKIMSKSSWKNCLHLVCVFALVLLSSTAAADDTEIYFTNAGSVNAAVRPNVLLILDSSGSMHDIVPNTGGKSRMQVMKQAMNKILDGMEDVNVGLMRFTYNSGGPVLFPISYIDGPAADVVSEPQDTNPSYSYTIGSGSDDAQEDVATSAVDVGSQTLDISQVLIQSGTDSIQVASPYDDAYDCGTATTALNDYLYTLNSCSLTSGVRFPGVAVPQGATINSAQLSLTPSDTSTGGSAEVAGEDIDNAPQFQDGGSILDVSTRPKTSSTVTWNFASTSPETQDVTPIVQQIVNRTGWTAGSALALILYNGTLQRQFYSYDKATSSTQLPTLNVDWSTTSGGIPQDQLVGLRFPSVDIPQGATVTSAKLVLTPTSDQTGASGEQWVVNAVNQDNTATFVNINGNISSRPTTTASVNWNVPDTTTDVPVNSPDLTSVVQEVVNRSGWCGGNAMAFVISSGSKALTRYFYSYEGKASVAPTLEVSYDATSPSGCYRKTETAQVNANYDDAEEDSGYMHPTNTLLNLGGGKVGVRFNNIDVPQGATILSANLSFDSWHTSTKGNPIISINGENVDNAATFSASPNDISNRTLTAATVNWSMPQFSTGGTWYDTPDVSTLVQEIVNRSGWASGNAMSFILGTGPHRRVAEAHDDVSNKAPRLTITYESTVGATSYKTVRERLKELVNQMPTRDWTPIVETLYEASHYWRGESVKYGLTRDNNHYARISHPGSYCDASGNCNGADTASYPPYGVDNPSGCDPTTNPDSWKCRGQQIEGTPKYISPFSSTLTCQSNYQVLLTDGEANSNSDNNIDAIKSEYLGGSDCQKTKSDGSSITHGEMCGIDLVKFMHDNDQSSTLSNKQDVSTYTIGFNTSGLTEATQYLKDMADAGTGQFYEASTAGDLVSVFNKILNQVKDDPTSFVSPSLATNAFNRLLSRDEIYFGLFTPSLNHAWPGNVKKYNICTDTTTGCTLGEILDANGNPAIDTSTDKFKLTAQSIWSSSIDGRATVKGGVGAEMTDYTKRVIYTDITPGAPTTPPASGTSLAFADNPGYQIDINTWDDSNLSDVRNEVCPTPSTTVGSDCENRMLWLLGKSINTQTSDASATTRWTVNDVLHSSPAVITYGGSDSNSDGVIDTYFDRLVVGTNDGGLRFINATTGKEEWEFMPQETMTQQHTLYDNAEGDHLYGLDDTPTLDVNDVNGDGFIDPSDGDYVHVIIGMRRGGSDYYALDLTPGSKLTDNTTAITPKFLWKISPSTTGFSRMGQTWSKPRMATIQTTSGYMKVLVFGGGYDPNLDNGFGTAATSNQDNLGNALYIVNPADGSLILSISGTGSGANIIAPNMHYSIPSRITIMDSDGDGVDDRLYFGDTGGQMWRVDLHGDIKLSGSGVQGTTVVGRLASISTAGGSPPVDERRIFEPPAVVQVKDSTYSNAAGGEYDYVMVGTGNRAHPLNTDVHDRFYAFRDPFITAMPDTDSNNLADSGYPQTGGPITNADMVDVTTSILDTSNTTKSSMGWYYDFNESGTTGEKVLSAPTAIAGAVFYTTYLPGVSNSADLCSANIGSGRAYDINFLTSKAALDWNENGSLDNIADRSKALGGGIPSDVVPVFTKEGVVGIVGVEGGASQLGALTGLPRYRTYWYEEK
jgi:type IV pilus assembly protein PilY1